LVGGGSIAGLGNRAVDRMNFSEKVSKSNQDRIDDPATLDINRFKRKSASVHWEFMFTRSHFENADIAEQGILLNEVSRLIDTGVLRTTMTERYSPIDAANLKLVHKLIESGTTRGKSY
jgi:NADPH:quinone reductase